MALNTLKCNRLKPLPFKGLKSDNLGSVECQQCSDVSAKCTGVVAGDFSDAAIDRQNCVESDTSQLLTFSQNDIVECRTLSSVNLDSGMHALATIGLVGSNSRGVHTLTSRANCWRNRFHLLLPPVGEQSIAISLSVCVCPRAYLWNCWTDLHEMFYADPLWPWLGPPLAAWRYVMYFRYYG